MKNKEEFYRNAISICWVILVQFVIVMCVVELMYSSIKNDFSGFIEHPGAAGTNVLIITTIVYSTLSLLVRFFSHTTFRWFIFGLSIFFFLFFVAHHLNHLIVDEKPLSLFSALDFAHHAVVLLSAVLSFLWARTGKKSS